MINVTSWFLMLVIISVLWMSCSGKGSGAGKPSYDDMVKCSDEDRVRWESDPAMFQEYNYPVNPFGRREWSHCRSNSQCVGGKCDQWFCH